MITILFSTKNRQIFINFHNILIDKFWYLYYGYQ
nr:MAG TPA: hypothetical protein [Bacteriophage sp.]